MRHLHLILAVALMAAIPPTAIAQTETPLTRGEVERALRKAVEFYWQKVSTQGGYHYSYAEDLSYGRSEHGDGLTQVEVQREATPSIGLAYLTAYETTGDRFYLAAARAACHALVKGQLCSGGWHYLIEFDPAKRRNFPYRANGKCGADRTKDSTLTTLDDNVTQGALRLMMRVDLALEFKDEAIHEAVRFALEQLIKAQYPNGAWPQRFRESPDPAKFPVKQASYPAAWPRVWPGASYQQFYTFNDNTISDAIDLFLEAARIYNEPRYRAAAAKGGGFILLAQMPEPQPAWAQQYDLDMHPAWARAFEPPSVTGGESQGIIRTLLTLYRETGDQKYLVPVQRALAYLQRSVLPPIAKPSEARRRFRAGEPVLARFYELQTNRPLYITKGTRVSVTGKPTTLLGGYEISYSDESVITHYSMLTSGAELAAIAAEYERLAQANPADIKRPLKLRGLSPWSNSARAERPNSGLARNVSNLINQMDNRGAWVEEGSIGKTGQVVSVFAAKEMVVKIGDRVLPLKENETLEIFQGAERPRERIIRSATFARNLAALCTWLAQAGR
jgi:hypothetical protein